MSFTLNRDSNILKIHNNKENACNCEKIYRENIDIFKALDYQLERYGIKYCIAIIQLNKQIKALKIDINSMIRLSDKYLQVNDNYGCILYVHADINQAYEASLALERKFIERVHIDISFKCAIVEKFSHCSSKTEILKASRMIELNFDEHIIF